MTDSILRLVYVPGKPIGWRRPRRHGKKYFPDPEYHAWKQQVGYTLRCKALILDPQPWQPLRLTLEVIYQRPMTRPKWWPKDLWKTGRAIRKPTRGDLDNVEKGVLDAMQSFGLIVDDAQVVEIKSRKIYAAAKERAGLIVTLEAIPLALS